jgi:hypothetical protein
MEVWILSENHTLLTPYKSIKYCGLQKNEGVLQRVGRERRLHVVSARLKTVEIRWREDIFGGNTE